MRAWRGSPYPLGATWDGMGVNFAIFSENATGAELCLFDAAGSERRVPVTQRTEHVWHVYVPDITVGQRYGYRVLEAASGQEALAVWGGHAAEIALLQNIDVVVMAIPALDPDMFRKVAQGAAAAGASVRYLPSFVAALERHYRERYGVDCPGGGYLFSLFGRTAAPAGGGLIGKALVAPMEIPVSAPVASPAPTPEPATPATPEPVTRQGWPCFMTIVGIMVDSMRLPGDMALGVGALHSAIALAACAWNATATGSRSRAGTGVRTKLP